MNELNQLTDDTSAENDTLQAQTVATPLAWYRRELMGFPVWFYAAGLIALFAVMAWALTDAAPPSASGGTGFMTEEPPEPLPEPVIDMPPSDPGPPPVAYGTPVRQPSPPVQPDRTAGELQDLRDFAQANREAITRLSGRLEQLIQAQAAKPVTGEPGSVPSRPTTALPPPPAPSPAAPPSSPPQQKPPATATPSVVKEIELVSIAGGMAWVKWQNKTWAVIPGDRLGTITVTRISPAERTVYTSAGMIR